MLPANPPRERGWVAFQHHDEKMPDFGFAIQAALHLDRLR